MRCSGTGTKRLLIRNVGPTLASFGVTGALTDPQLTLQRYDAATGAYSTVATNDNWGTTTPLSTLTTTTASLGAFALASASADSALLVDLAPGQYTALAGGVGGSTGVALVELYDADTTTPTARLSNIATRGYVGTGNIAIVDRSGRVRKFVDGLIGNAPKRVMEELARLRTEGRP